MDIKLFYTHINIKKNLNSDCQELNLVPTVLHNEICQLLFLLFIVSMTFYGKTLKNSKILNVYKKLKKSSQNSLKTALYLVIANTSSR